jgi:YVTN family beta-propeller protein
MITGTTNRALLMGLMLSGSVVIACEVDSDHDQEAEAGVQPADVALRSLENGESYTLFESGQVRPIALSPSGRFLYVVNTPDNRLEVYQVKNGGTALKHRASVPVGLEPVAVAVRSDDEVWVVNHLSDSVSVVDTSKPKRSRVVRTLLVGDEPRDIVFAGPDAQRAFITTAHRGQNNPADPQLTTPGIGRADVWVFDAEDLGASLEGTPLNVITLFTDTPRALAVTPDGSKVYAAGFHTGNKTTVVNRVFVQENGGAPPPTANVEGIEQPPPALIVKHDGAHWVDELGRSWDDFVRFSLPDKDVFVIDAMADPPAPLDGPDNHYPSVGTVLFNMVVNPVSGKVYVSNTEALNENRFEGPGIIAGHSVRGHVHESRITVLGPASSVTPRHLNKHIDYSTCCAPSPNPESENSLAQPLEMAVTSDGATLYVAALGSGKIGVFDTAELENDTFVPDSADHIEVSGGGPTGLVLDEDRDRLYVLTRFDNSISVIDTDTGTETQHIAMYNPEPLEVVHGRRFLYDARDSSSHGDSSCASCHIFGDMDGLAWDLGNPDGFMLDNPGPTVLPAELFFEPDHFHPMKGPMTTQSLRGMDNHGPMHWRGDRTGGHDAPTVEPDGGTFDENTAFMKFIVAFEDLLGRGGPIPVDDMQAFADFALRITYPPNPIRALDNSRTPLEQEGLDFFLNNVYINEEASPLCVSCHTLDPDHNAEFNERAPGLFGTNGQYTGDAQAQIMKVPHLRNGYQKIGMFGFPPHPTHFDVDNEFMGDQVRGFGFVHDGNNDTIFRFLQQVGFAVNSPFQAHPVPTAIPDGPAGDPIRRALEALFLAFDSNMAPIVGQQVTLTSALAAQVNSRIDLLVARADVGECDLVAKGRFGNQEVGYLYIGDGDFMPNRVGEPTIADIALRALVVGTDRELTYTCVPPNAGVRVALDRDGDTFLDGDEEACGTSTMDPTDHP